MYGSYSYGAAPYGGEVPSGAKSVQLSLKYTVITTPAALTKSLEYTVAVPKSPLTLPLRYAVGVPLSLTESIEYTVATSHTLTLSLQYVVRPTFTLPLKYTVITTPATITKSLEYAIGIQHTLTESLQYAVGPVRTIPLSLKYTVETQKTALKMPLTYVVIPTITDDEDYSKGIVIAEYVSDDQVLWNGYSASANEITRSLDVSTAGSLQIYLQTDLATTIYIQILTADGWVNYGPGVTFTGADSTFYPIWFLTFSQVRFQTTAAAKLTIECFIRT